MKASSSATGVDYQLSRTTLWVGVLITVLGVASNWLYFVNLPGQRILPWINLVLPAVGLLVLFLALWRAYARRGRFGGKLLAPVFVLICTPLVAMSVWGFFHARNVPPSLGAPLVGQKAPYFVLVSSAGESVSLSQMLSERMGNSAPPKAVLLIFYRGYW